MEAYDHQALRCFREGNRRACQAYWCSRGGSDPASDSSRDLHGQTESTFVNKKSREQFEIRTHKRIINIEDPNPRTVEALNRLVVPAGVFVKIKA